MKPKAEELAKGGFQSEKAFRLFKSFFVHIQIAADFEHERCDGFVFPVVFQRHDRPRKRIIDRAGVFVFVTPIHQCFQNRYVAVESVATDADIGGVSAFDAEHIKTRRVTVQVEDDCVSRPV